MTGNTTGTTTTDDVFAALSRLLNKGVSGERKCSFAKFIDESPEEFQVAIAQVLDSDLSHRTIFVELQKAGIRISRETITLHRTGRCICTEGGK